MTSVRSPSPFSSRAIALAGLISLATAMGIGRFAFTPIIPLMLAEQSVDITAASLLASANYLGYLVGALFCTFQPWIWRRLGWRGSVSGPALVRWGLAATAVLTLGMALHLPAGWVLLRFTAGVASALVFLYTAAFCLEQLARRGKPAMGALIFVGPGLGIAATGLATTALVAQWHVPAAVVWLVFGLVAALSTAAVWRVFDAGRGVAAPARAAGPAGHEVRQAQAGTGEVALLTIAYGLAGLGYIITATFLPVIARQALPDSPWLDYFWPLFGFGVMLGALFSSRLGARGDLRLRLVAAYLVQAVGVAASAVSPTLAGFVLGSLLVGMPMTVIAFFAMQEARRVRPLQATSLMGLQTVVYGVGQIAGPPLAAWLVAHSANAGQGFQFALWIAAGVLVMGAGLYLLIAWRHPMPGAARAAPRTPG